MKKLYSLILAAFVGSFAANAQLSLSLKLPDGEKTLENGATITYNTITEDDGDFFIKPPLYLNSTASLTNVKVNVTSDNTVQICGFGGCMIQENFAFDGVKVGPNDPIFFDMETPIVRSKDDIVKTTMTIEVSNPLSISSKRAITLVLDPGNTTALDNTLAAADKVTVAGNMLNYGVNGDATLRVYTIVGERVVNVSVSGNGSIDISRLPKGIYLYEVIGSKKLTGKFMH